MPTNKNLSNLVINKVESQTVYDQMKAQNLINEDELYLVNDTAEVAAHTQSADTITEGTFGAVDVYAVNYTDYTEARVRNIGLLDGAMHTDPPPFYAIGFDDGDIALIYE